MSRDPDKVKFKPGPEKGKAPILPEIGITRCELAIRVGHDLVRQGISPTIANIAAAEPRLSVGFLNKNSKALAPCRKAYDALRANCSNKGPTSCRSDETTSPDDNGEEAIQSVIALAEARAARAIRELKAEQLAHDRTKEALRQQEALNARLLKGYADEIGK